MTEVVEDEEIVIQYKLRRDECPALFEDLAARKKGLPRAGRLKVLVLRGFDVERSSGGDRRESRQNAGAPPETPSMRGNILSDLIEGKTE